MSSIIKSIYANELKDSMKQIEVKTFVHEVVDKPLTETLSSEQAKQIISAAQETSRQLKKQADEYMESARAQIQHEQQQWEQEKQRLYEAESRKGYQSGYEQGRADGYEEYQGVLDKANQIVEEARQKYYDYMNQAEEVILELGFTLAEKIIHEELQVNNNFLSLVKGALKEVRENKEIQLFVSPHYYSYVCEKKYELFELLNGEASLFIYVDEHLEETDCIIESSFGRIDASIDSQLVELKKKLKERLLEGSKSESRAVNF
ncbi:flagellar assembly protein FliH [Priestia megaterium]|nr:flagellar assembly protein FliH [Priestia megaterium]